jgi:hypothetical protein
LLLIFPHGFDFVDHVVFSPFLDRFSRGTRGEWGLLARSRAAAFCGAAKKVRFIVFFLGGTANPEGGVAEAEARSAASAQACFPTRRARESGARKGNGKGEVKAGQQEKSNPPVIDHGSKKS